MQRHRAAHPSPPQQRRLVAHYLTDLVVSVGLVLGVGWFFQTAGGHDLHDALLTQSAIYRAISLFTPTNLVASYITTLHSMTQFLQVGYAPGNGFMPAAFETTTSVALLMIDLILAVPRTFFGLYSETSGTASWIVLAGFCAAIAAVFIWLLAARISSWRLLLATALSPIAVMVLFTMLQTFMSVTQDAFVWLTAFAPYVVACPVLCAIYWIVFPNADCGATASVARAVGRVLNPTR